MNKFLHKLAIKTNSKRGRLFDVSIQVLIILTFFPIIALGQNKQDQDYHPKSDFHFTENKGQLNQKVYFHTKLHLGDIYFEKNTFTFDLYSAKDLDKAHKLRHARKNKNQLVETPIILRKGVYKMCFIGANTTPNIFAEAQKEGLKNYFIGNDRAKLEVLLSFE